MALDLFKSRISILINIANSDGEFARIEREFIRKIAKQGGMSEEEFEKTVDEPGEMSDDFSGDDLSMDEKFEIIHAIVLLMNVDGKLKKEEINYCLKVARQLGYKESVLFEFITAVTNGQSFSVEKEVIKPKVQQYLQ